MANLSDLIGVGISGVPGGGGGDPILEAKLRLEDGTLTVFDDVEPALDYGDSTRDDDDVSQLANTVGTLTRYYGPPNSLYVLSNNSSIKTNLKNIDSKLLTHTTAIDTKAQKTGNVAQTFSVGTPTTPEHAARNSQITALNDRVVPLENLTSIINRVRNAIESATPAFVPTETGYGFFVETWPHNPWPTAKRFFFPSVTLPNYGKASYGGYSIPGPHAIQRVGAMYNSNYDSWMLVAGEGGDGDHVYFVDRMTGGLYRPIDPDTGLENSYMPAYTTLAVQIGPSALFYKPGNYNYGFTYNIGYGVAPTYQKVWFLDANFNPINIGSRYFIPSHTLHNSTRVLSDRNGRTFGLYENFEGPHGLGTYYVEATSNFDMATDFPDAYAAGWWADNAIVFDGGIYLVCRQSGGGIMFITSTVDPLGNYGEKTFQPGVIDYWHFGSYIAGSFCVFNSGGVNYYMVEGSYGPSYFSYITTDFITWTLVNEAGVPYGNYCYSSHQFIYPGQGQINMSPALLLA